MISMKLICLVALIRYILIDESISSSIISEQDLQNELRKTTPDEIKSLQTNQIQITSFDQIVTELNISSNMFQSSNITFSQYKEPNPMLDSYFIYYVTKQNMTFVFESINPVSANFGGSNKNEKSNEQLHQIKIPTSINNIIDCYRIIRKINISNIDESENEIVKIDQLLINYPVIMTDIYIRDLIYEITPKWYGDNMMTTSIKDPIIKNMVSNHSYMKNEYLRNFMKMDTYDAINIYDLDYFNEYFKRSIRIHSLKYYYDEYTDLGDDRLIDNYNFVGVQLVQILDSNNLWGMVSDDELKLYDKLVVDLVHLESFENKNQNINSWVSRIIRNEKKTVFDKYCNHFNNGFLLLLSITFDYTPIPNGFNETCPELQTKLAEFQVKHIESIKDTKTVYQKYKQISTTNKINSYLIPEFKFIDIQFQKPAVVNEFKTAISKLDPSKIEIPFNKKLDIAFNAIIKHGDFTGLGGKIVNRFIHKNVIGQIFNSIGSDYISTKNPWKPILNQKSELKLSHIGAGGSGDIQLFNDIIFGDHFNENNPKIVDYVKKEIKTYQVQQMPSSNTAKMADPIDVYHNFATTKMTNSLGYNSFTLRDHVNQQRMKKPRRSFYKK
jgi:hypothetical protein